MRTVRTGFWLVVLAASLAACRSKGSAASVAPDPNAPVAVEVECHFHGDVVIYLVQGSQRQRLGTVTALSRAEFSFPYGRLSMSGTTRLMAYPIAGAQAHFSEPLLVQPGQWVSWTLESDLDRSSLAVY